MNNLDWELLHYVEINFYDFGMVSWEVINKNTNWGVILLFAATISLGFQINDTGAAEWLINKFK
ncbi:MAG: hypothetical protein Ct9H90mP15_04150 [Candidatus Neomarinimicrobiota bacterium]|nr:MAG: hypothetical protein Ct9H90mP15_04150 [Candidatus Neomarinimicrobiota bacterium]